MQNWETKQQEKNKSRKKLGNQLFRTRYRINKTKPTNFKKMVLLKENDKLNQEEKIPQISRRWLNGPDQWSLEDDTNYANEFRIFETAREGINFWFKNKWNLWISEMGLQIGRNYRRASKEYRFLWLNAWRAISVNTMALNLSWICTNSMWGLIPILRDILYMIQILELWNNNILN